MTVKFSISENKSRCMFAVYSELLFNKKYLTHIDTIAAYILNRFILQGIQTYYVIKRLIPSRFKIKTHSLK